VTAALILRSGHLATSRRMSANRSWFETREDALLTVRLHAALRHPYTGSAIEYFTWLNAKLDSIEAMPSSRVSLFFKNAS
jgi:hypothetical protein